MAIGLIYYNEKCGRCPDFSSDDMKRYFILKINKRVLVPITMVMLSAIPFYFSPGAWADIAFAAAALALILWSCGKDTRDLIISKFTKTHGSTK